MADKKVTPHVGVWIETIKLAIIRKDYEVTPHVGVWIETSINPKH